MSATSAIAALAVLATAWIASVWLFPQWSRLVLAPYVSLLILLLCRERLFSAADLPVKARGALPASAGGGEAGGGRRSPHRAPNGNRGVDGHEAPARAVGEPVRKGGEGVVVLSDYRSPERSERSGRSSS